MGTKAIIIDIRSTPDDPGYRDRGTVIGDGEEILWHEDMSSCPNPCRPSDRVAWDLAYGWCAVPGQYRWMCAVTDSHGKCLRLTDPANAEHQERIPTLYPNHNHDCAYYADGVLVHCGYSADWRGSAACHTVPPARWSAFTKLFAVGESGLYIVKRDVVPI